MNHRFNDLTLPELLDIIILQTEMSDEAMWYLLHERMKPALMLKYQKYRDGLCDDYEDLLGDFFFYLREGRETYMPLRTIKNQEAFDKWLVSTWNNFLNSRLTKNVVDDIDTIDVADNDEDELTDERKIEIASQLIAYCDQVFPPRGRFVFLRTLLTLLDKQNALPEKEIAEALGMTDVGYRVTNHRMKSDARQFMERLLNEEALALDEKHLRMSERIYDGFNELYGVLMSSYEDVLTTMNQRDKVMALRIANARSDGMMLHEEEAKDYQMGIRPFWNRLKRVLINIPSETLSA